MHAPGNRANPPQPRMPPWQPHTPPSPRQPCTPPSNHTCSPRQPCTPPRQPRMPLGNHAHPPATMHAPQQPCMCPTTTPLVTMHAPRQPCMPPSSHACPLAGMHAPQPCMPPWQPCMPPLWIEWQTSVKILPCQKLRLRAVIITRRCWQTTKHILQENNPVGCEPPVCQRDSYNEQILICWRGGVLLGGPCTVRFKLNKFEHIGGGVPVQ